MIVLTRVVLEAREALRENAAAQEALERAAVDDTLTKRFLGTAGARPSFEVPISSTTSGLI